MYYSAHLVILVAYENLRQIIEQYGMPIWGASKAKAPNTCTSFLSIMMLSYILFLSSITDRLYRYYIAAKSYLCLKRNEEK